MPVWKEKCIRLQTKLRIFKTNVKSALLYGSETSEIDETTDQEIADIYQQVFKEDPEYLLARGHLKRRTMGKDTSESYRRKHQEKKVEMDRAYATEA